MKLLPQEDNFFGLDIGASSIKLTQLRELRGQPSLLTYGDLTLDQNYMASDSEIDIQKMADAISGLAVDAKISTKNVVASLGASQSYVATIKTPKLSHEELNESIRFQADKVIPIAIDQLKLDWVVLNEAEVKNEDDELEILLVATAISTANKYLNVLQLAGFELLALETNAIAQSRSLLSKSDKSSKVILLDIGMNASDIAITANGIPKLVRSIPIGGKSILRSVTQNLAIDETQAEQFLQKFGLDQTKIEGQLYKTLKPIIDHLVEEIQKSISYFLQEENGDQIAKIILTGGVTALTGLPLYLANALNITVEIGNPWQNIRYPSDLAPSLAGLSLGYATALGLSLRGTQV